jgi:UDP-glucose 4-epimerase
VIAIYADNTKAKEQLGWNIKYDIDDMMHTAWEWEQKLQEG